MLLRLPPGERREVYARFGPELGRAVFEIGPLLIEVRYSARIIAEKVDCPILVVGGREDRMTPAWAMRRVARRYRATYREAERLRLPLTTKQSLGQSISVRRSSSQRASRRA